MNENKYNKNDFLVEYNKREELVILFWIRTFLNHE